MSTIERTGRPGKSTARPIALWLYVVGAVALGASALLGGAMLILDPSGNSLDIPLSYLQGSPFADYLIPGILLFTVFGLGSIVVLYAIVTWQRWAWYAALGLGGGQVVWIAVEMAVIGELQPLHVAYGGLGVILVALALMPSVRSALQ